MDNRGRQIREPDPAVAPAPATLLLPPALVRLFPGADSCVEVRATTVAEALDALNARWPGMRDRLLDSTPEIRRHIGVFVDGYRAELGTRVPPGADVFIMTLVSGG